jgi:CRISPR-associated protein Csb2
MLTIEITLINGRYHSTPWGRNVNEGVPEWPPSPYRLVRALIDTWKRKRPEWDEARVSRALESIGSSPPEFHLPAATSAAVVCFQNSNTESVTDRQPVYDGFVVTKPMDKILMSWPHSVPEQSSLKDLDELLSLLNYLGRSESWISARATDTVPGLHINCAPVAGSVGPDMEAVQVAVPLMKPEFERERAGKAKSGEKERPKRGRKTMAVDVSSAGMTWLQALGWSTGDILMAKMSEPPAFRQMTYARRANCFMPEPVASRKSRAMHVNAVLYSVDSRVPERITRAVEVAERVHINLMGIHKRLVGDPDRVSPKFSGKDQSGAPLRGHQHVYLLPFDSNGDGWIDRMLIRCRAEFDEQELRTLNRLTSVYQRDGKPDLRLVPIEWGIAGKDFLKQGSTVFRSETPFVSPRHYRKGRGNFVEWLAGEVKREAENHGLPAPQRIMPLSKLRKQGKDIRWLEFTRSRKGKADMLGFGFEIEFEKPLHGPLSLGMHAHFGLGLFVPDNKNLVPDKR